jgi:hypothetical protein
VAGNGWHGLEWQSATCFSDSGGNLRGWPSICGSWEGKQSRSGSSWRWGLARTKVGVQEGDGAPVAAGVRVQVVRRAGGRRGHWVPVRVGVVLGGD